MLRAVIFDFDGTIADTVSALREAINLTMRKHGYPEHTEKEIQSYINNGARELVRRAMPEGLQKDEALVDRVFADYNEDYGRVYMHTDRAYDGIPELIRDLHEQGLKIGVLSNKQHVFVQKLSKQVLLPGTYDTAQGVVAGKPTKPHPYLSRLVAEDLGVRPEECVMIGDSDVDILTAKNAGMTHVGVSWGYRDEAFLRAHGAENIAHTPAELKEILTDLKKDF